MEGTRELGSGLSTLDQFPQDRQGRFSTEGFERYQCSDKALVSALTEMYVQGVSTRKVKAISSTVNRLEHQLNEFGTRRLEEDSLYLILNARYVRVRDGVEIRPCWSSSASTGTAADAGSTPSTHRASLETALRV